MALSPGHYRGDGSTIIDSGLQFGLIAQDVCAVDERLCARFPDGSPRTFIPSAVIALLVATVQKQQHEIEDLQGVAEAMAWKREHEAEVATWPPAWQLKLTADFETHVEELRALAEKLDPETGEILDRTLDGDDIPDFPQDEARP